MTFDNGGDGGQPSRFVLGAEGAALRERDMGDGVRHGNQLDKLKDGFGDYVWRSSSTAGVPPTRLGRPIEFDENFPGIGAGTYPIAFADWQQAYVVVDRLGLRLVRDPYTNKMNVLFDCFKRVGGGDLIKQTTDTEGTGAFVLGPSVSGFWPFPTFADDTPVYDTAVDNPDASTRPLVCGAVVTPP